jgi:AhpD family alkylhydroperoxidase
MTMEDRDPAAWEMIEALFPDAGAEGMAFLERLDPSYRQWWERTVFGGLYPRQVLDQKIRELCALSALVMTGRLPQVRAHVIAAHRAGASRAEIQEVIFQNFIFGGAPVVLGALEVMVDVLGEPEPAEPPS